MKASKMIGNALGGLLAAGLFLFAVLILEDIIKHGF